MAIVDLVSILPSVTFINNGFRVLKVSRLFRSLRVFRIFKSFRYSKNVALIIRVFSKQKDSLMVVIWFALGYIFISALVIFTVAMFIFGLHPAPMLELFRQVVSVI